jgi:glucan phosphoethanolaminetransferase (alkaline phosphatase superfamily)
LVEQPLNPFLLITARLLHIIRRLTRQVSIIMDMRQWCVDIVFVFLCMTIMVGMFLQPVGVSMFNTKVVKRRDPIAFDLLVSGTYKPRKVSVKKLYKRNFRNQRDFEVKYS